MNLPVLLKRGGPGFIHIGAVSKQFALSDRNTVQIHLFGGPEITQRGMTDLNRTGDWQFPRPKHHKGVEFDPIIPLFSCGIITFVAHFSSDFCTCAVRTPGQHDWARIYRIAMRILVLGQDIFQPNFG